MNQEQLDAAEKAVREFGWDDYGHDDLTHAIRAGDAEWPTPLARKVLEAVEAVPRWTPIDAQTGKKLDPATLLEPSKYTDIGVTSEGVANRQDAPE